MARLFLNARSLSRYDANKVFGENILFPEAIEISKGCEPRPLGKLNTEHIQLLSHHLKLSDHSWIALRHPIAEGPSRANLFSQDRLAWHTPSKQIRDKRRFRNV